MKLTDYHAKFLAYELTRQGASDSMDKLAGAVASAQVDLNPHQVDAALFAFKSPLSRGALLADEVGLGKTIEAGIVISQHWAERKKKLLVITPANLRKQWHQELSEKFFLPCRILEAKSYNQAVRHGEYDPFGGAADVVICSYQFARSKAADVARIPWDLVVIDEAHRLRNVYKPTNVIANTIRGVLRERRKLLLTATPLQNSILELYGLVSVIDEHAFGDVKSFREQFSSLTDEEVYSTLRARLRPICHRTLRRQVTAYVSYTKRVPILEMFEPDETEDRLYELVSEYLRRPNLQALPSGQRALMTLVLRKLLASSSFAIAGALETMAARLRKSLGNEPNLVPLDEELDEDFETLDEEREEWDEESQPEGLSDRDRAAIRAELEELEEFARLATTVNRNAKGEALLRGLQVAMAKAAELGAAEKAIIFTESRKTQNYLLRILADTPWADGIVLFNGSNTDERSKEIFAEWLARHKGTDRVTGSRTSDMRSALVDYFENDGKIMIATDAGAEGINLQFCSLVVNYDLPWNPQRIEQRIGRCHRYGQKHDVVVVNFLNVKNAADVRVFQLLEQKFKLFEGVFGASDEILGSIESGVDLERRIGDIYQACRKSEEIQEAFDGLQLELQFEINEQMTVTRRKLLENFDDEVREKLRVQDRESRAVLGKFEMALMDLTRHELDGCANFVSGTSFELGRPPFGLSVPTGLYELPRRSPNAHIYRVNHPLAEALIERAKGREVPAAEVLFDLTNHEGKVSILEPLVGMGGFLSLSLFDVKALDQSEQHLIFAGTTDGGAPVDEEQCARMLGIPGTVASPMMDASVAELDSLTEQRRATLAAAIAQRNAAFFQAEAAKLDGWADDLKVGLEREIKDFDRQIREAKRSATAAPTLEEKLEWQKEIRALEGERNRKRRSLFDAQDDIDRQREELIANIEGKLSQTSSLERLFTIRWRLN